MKITIEKVERLRESADVGFEVAKEALEANNGDLLEAVIALEREGKLGPNAGRKNAAVYAAAGGEPGSAIGQSYGAGASPQTYVSPNFVPGQDTTFAAGGNSQQWAGYSGGKKSRWGGAKASQGGDPQGASQGGSRKYKDESTGFEDGAERFFSWFGRVIRAGCTNHFEIWRRSERVLYFPVILFLFCLIHWVFWLTLIALIICLFAGCRFQFSGPHLGRKSVNDALNKAAEVADDIKNGEKESDTENKAEEV